LEAHIRDLGREDLHELFPDLGRAPYPNTERYDFTTTRPGLASVGTTRPGLASVTAPPAAATYLRTASQTVGIRWHNPTGVGVRHRSAGGRHLSAHSVADRRHSVEKGTDGCTFFHQFESGLTETLTNSLFELSRSKCVPLFLKHHRLARAPWGPTPL
jgi:hypothetical protein